MSGDTILLAIEKQKGKGKGMLLRSHPELCREINRSAMIDKTDLKNHIVKLLRNFRLGETSRIAKLIGKGDPDQTWHHCELCALKGQTEEVGQILPGPVQK